MCALYVCTKDRCRSQSRPPIRRQLELLKAVSPNYEPYVNQFFFFFFYFIGGGFKLNYICEYEATQTTHRVTDTYTQKRGMFPEFGNG